MAVKWEIYVNVYVCVRARAVNKELCRSIHSPRISPNSKCVFVLSSSLVIAVISNENETYTHSYTHTQEN